MEIKKIFDEIRIKIDQEDIVLVNMGFVAGLASTMRFGKYKGKLVRDVLHNDPQYIIWALNNVETFQITPKLEEKLLAEIPNARTQYSREKIF